MSKIYAQSKKLGGGEGGRKDITLGVSQYDVLTGKENEQTL